MFPHEQTYGGPKEDRLALTKATQAGISQVFCLFEDQDNDLTEQLYCHITGPADYYGKLDDVQNEVWVLTEQSVLNAVHQGMLCRRVFIADGHHRYGTALLYRQWLAQQQGGKLGEDHPANFLACMFVSMAEPGLLVLPTHRTIFGIKQVNLDKIAAALDDKFHLRWKKLQEVADPQALLEQSDPMAFGLASGGDDRLLVAWPKQVDALLEDLADKYSAVWRALQVAIVHNYVLDQVIFKDSRTGSEELRIEYARERAIQILNSQTISGTVSVSIQTFISAPARPLRVPFARNGWRGMVENSSELIMGAAWPVGTSKVSCHWKYWFSSTVGAVYLEASSQGWAANCWGPVALRKATDNS